MAVVTKLALLLLLLALHVEAARDNTDFDDFPESYVIPQSWLDDLLEEHLALRGNHSEDDMMDQLFGSMDHDHSGSVSVFELEQALMKSKQVQHLFAVNPTEGNAHHRKQLSMKMFLKIDIDGSGSISKQEFMDHSFHHMQRHRENRSHPTPWRLFDDIDVDDDGKITAHELSTILATSEDRLKYGDVLGLEGWQDSLEAHEISISSLTSHLIMVFDADGDGAISYHELLTHVEAEHHQLSVRSVRPGTRVGGALDDQNSTDFPVQAGLRSAHPHHSDYSTPRLESHTVEKSHSFRAMKKEFNAIDADGDGEITSHELAIAMATSEDRVHFVDMFGGEDWKQGPASAELSVSSFCFHVMMEFDSGGDGTISYEELVTHFEASSRANPGTMSDEMRQKRRPRRAMMYGHEHGVMPELVDEQPLVFKAGEQDDGVARPVEAEEQDDGLAKAVAAERKEAKEEDPQETKRRAEFAYESLICPITHEIMQDPVFTSDGQTYERKAIAKWLATHDTSPVTNEILENKILKPNYMARGLIHEFLRQHQTQAAEADLEAEAGAVAAAEASGAPGAEADAWHHNPSVMHARQGPGAPPSLDAQNISDQLLAALLSHRVNSPPAAGGLQDQPALLRLPASPAIAAEKQDLGESFLVPGETADKAKEVTEHLSMLGQIMEIADADGDKLSESVKKWAEDAPQIVAEQGKAMAITVEDAVNQLTQQHNKVRTSISGILPAERNNNDLVARH